MSVDRHAARGMKHRRRMLVSAAWQKVNERAQAIARERGIPLDEAVTAVFDDEDMLLECHNVGNVPVPDPPESPIAVQNG